MKIFSLTWSQKSGGSFFLVLTLSLIFLVSVPSLSEAKEIEEEGLALSLQKCIALALEKNLDIMIQRMNPQIRELDIVREKAVFDPIFALSVKKSESAAKGTSFWSGTAPEGSLLNRFLGWEENMETETVDFNSSIAKKISTGGQYKLQFNHNTFKTSNAWQYDEKTYYTTLTFSLMQPLLKGFGTTLNRTGIKIAGNNRDISADELKMKITAVVSTLQETYWDLVAAAEELTVRRQSLALAHGLLDRNEALVEAGRLPSIAILHAETGVASRKEGVLLAQNAAKAAQDRLRKMIGLLGQPSRTERPIFPSDKPTFIEKKIDLAESFEVAINNRPDFNQAKTAFANQELSVNLAKNQSLPKLDLLANYSVNDTGSKYGESTDDLFEGDTYSWEAGVMLEIPLGNRRAKNKHTQEKIKLQMAKVEVNNREKNILLEVRAAVRDLETNRQRIDVTGSARVLAEKKLTAEEERFKLGRSTTTDLLKFQEELTLAKSNENRALIDYQKSLSRWEAATGQTLQKHNIEIASH